MTEELVALLFSAFVVAFVIVLGFVAYVSRHQRHD